MANLYSFAETFSDQVCCWVDIPQPYMENHAAYGYKKILEEVSHSQNIYSRRKTSSKIPSRFYVGSNLKSRRKVIFLSALSIPESLRLGTWES